MLFALVLDRLDAGSTRRRRSPRRASGPSSAAEEPSRLNLLLADGASIWATRRGNSLFAARTDGGVAVASEPWDDDPAWSEVPDGSGRRRHAST